MNRTLTATIAAITILGLAGCASAEAQPVAAPAAPVQVEVTPTPEPAPVIPITVAAVGDSITAWGAADGVNNWTEFLTSGPVVVNTDDGWAVGGTKLAEQAAGILPIHSDVLVVMGGTNDMGTPRWATPIGERLASLDIIVVKSQATRVLIMACAPRSTDGRLPGDPAWVTEWNTAAAELAALRGWDFVDPWTDVRAADGTWASPAYTVEGVHPTPEASALVAARVAAKIESMGVAR